MRSRQSFTARSILENGTSSGIGARYYTGMSKLGRNAFLTRRQLPPNFGGGGGTRASADPVSPPVHGGNEPVACRALDRPDCLRFSSLQGGLDGRWATACGTIAPELTLGGAQLGHVVVAEPDLPQLLLDLDQADRFPGQCLAEIGLPPLGLQRAVPAHPPPLPVQRVVPVPAPVPGIPGSSARRTPQAAAGLALRVAALGRTSRGISGADHGRGGRRVDGVVFPS